MNNNFFDFYYVNQEYLEYLCEAEFKVRNLSFVPNLNNPNYKYSKFVAGSVLKIDNFKYYAPVSHITKYYKSSYLLKTDNRCLGSIRFSFMIPIPDNCLTRLVINDIDDPKYRSLISKEYRIIKSNWFKITKKALNMYKVINNNEYLLKDYSCDFKLLEQACSKYQDKLKNLHDRVVDVKGHSAKLKDGSASVGIIPLSK